MGLDRDSFSDMSQSSSTSEEDSQSLEKCNKVFKKYSISMKTMVNKQRERIDLLEDKIKQKRQKVAEMKKSLHMTEKNLNTTLMYNDR